MKSTRCKNYRCSAPLMSVRTAYVCDLPMMHRAAMWWQLAAVALAPSTIAAHENHACSEGRACWLWHALVDAACARCRIPNVCVLYRHLRSSTSQHHGMSTHMQWTGIHVPARRSATRTLILPAAGSRCSFLSPPAVRQLPHRFMRPHPHAIGRSVRRSPSKRCVASRHLDSGGVQSHSSRQPRSSCKL